MYQQKTGRYFSFGFLTVCHTVALIAYDTISLFFIVESHTVTCNCSYISSFWTLCIVVSFAIVPRLVILMQKQTTFSQNSALFNECHFTNIVLAIRKWHILLMEEELITLLEHPGCHIFFNDFCVAQCLIICCMDS